MNKYLIIALVCTFTFCSGRMVQRDKLNFLNAKYGGIYVLKEKVDIGNNSFMNPGAKVKLFIKSGSENVKVYAYNHKEPKEQAIGKNILYLFESDFTDEEFNRKEFEDKLGLIVEKSN